MRNGGASMVGFVVEPKQGLVRPFVAWRAIRRGRNKGRYEVELPTGRPRRVIVDREAVRRWPTKQGVK